MRSGETVLVTAAAGGVGQFVVQLAKQAGNTVVATCGSDEKARLLRSVATECAAPVQRRSINCIQEATLRIHPQHTSLQSDTSVFMH